MPASGSGAATSTTAAGTAYTSPSATQIRLRTGINPSIEDLTSAALDTKLLSLLADAEARTALAVTIAVFDLATLTSRQVTALQIAVSKRVGADYLRLVALEKVTGTHETLLMEEAEAFLAQAAALEAEAAVYDDLAAGTAGESAGALEIGTILTSSPNEYLDSFRPLFLGEEEYITQ